MRYLLIVMIFLLLTSCNREEANQYQGYAEGRYTYISANFPGKLERLNVERGNQVKQNDALFILDQEPEKSTHDKAIADLAQAKSAVSQFQAAFILNKRNYERTQQLLKSGTVTLEAYDAAKSAYEQSDAQLREAKQNVNSLEAVLSQSTWQIQQKTLYAPKSAFVFDTYYLPGEWVPAGQPVLALLSSQDMKIIFFINEKTLASIFLGQKVLINCDNCQKNYTGRITYISPSAEYTPPIIYSDERRDKLVYRVEAFPDNPDFFHPGMPVKISIVF